MDTILLNGRFLTMDDSRPEARAIAIRGGRIAAVGDAGAVRQEADPDAEVVDLIGRTVVPGFIDTHNHFAITSFDPLGVDCSTPPNESLNQIHDRIRAAAADSPAGRWIRGFGYNDLLLSDHRHPTRAELDEVCPDNPLTIVHWSLHRVVANSMALRLAGIDRDTPDPEGGVIRRDGTGEPTGLLYETAMDPVMSLSLDAWLTHYPERVPELIAWNARRLHAHGITGIHDVCTHPRLAAVYRELAAAGGLPIYLSIYGGSGAGLFPPPAEYLDRIAADAPADGTGRLRERGLKIFLDGAFSRVAMRIDWPDGRCRSSGHLFYPDAELRSLLDRAAELDVQVTGHAVGNRAIGQFLEAIADVQAARQRSDPRYRIEHFEMVTDNLLDRTRELGVLVSSQSMLIHDSADLTLGLDLPDQMKIAPYRSMIDRGIHLTSSSDFPCMTLNPADWIWGMVTRRTLKGVVVHPDECLDVLTAIRLSTINAAAAGFAEGTQGSITPGKVANLAVLSADPRSVAEDAIRDIKVEETYLDGERVYVRG